MKIAHVCPFYTPAIGGVKQVVEELAKRQLKEGNEVHVYTSDWDKEKRIDKKYEIIDGVHVHRCKHILRIANFVTIWPSLFFKLLKEDFEVIHSHLFGHPHFILSALVARIKGINHIHTTHCPWTDSNRSLVGRLGLLVSYNLFSRWALKFTKNIIAITPWEIGFIKKYGGKDGQIINLPNGMENGFFNKITPNDFKKKLGIKNKMILFFGRYNITKNPQHFILMAREILKERKDIDFVMIGPDEGEFEKVKSLAKGNKNIHVLGPMRNKQEIIKMYQSAEVYVLPSFREGLPLTLFEALASGLPIVSTPVNGIPYEIKDNVNGFLVQPGNIKGLVESVKKILNSRKLSNKFKENNTKKAKDYSWDLINKKTFELYKND
jgi:glycosyltransferase involved in cell wall biosynthesis